MLKRFMRYYKPHKHLFILDMSVAFLSAAITIFIPVLTREIIRSYIPQQSLRLISHSLIIMFAIIVMKTVFTKIRIKWGHILGVRMEYDMREELFRHIQKLSFSYFDNVKTGHLMSRISNDLNMIAEVAHHAPEDFMISIVMIIGAFLVMFSFNATLAAITLIPMPILFIWGYVYGGKMRKGFRSLRKKIADLNSSVENSVQGIREVKSYANESVEIEKFGSVNNFFKLAKEHMYTIMSNFHSGMGFFHDFYTVWVISAGVYLIFHDKLYVADLIAFMMFITYILNPIQRFVNFMEQFQQGAASFERFVEILDIEPEIMDKKNALDLKKWQGNIELNKVSFHYPGHIETVLKDVTLKIPAGKTVALVGESGAGKTTLISLIPRFYEVDQGSIVIDGHNILDLKQSFLRKNIGIVQQNVFLFDTTVRDNILYGNPYAGTDEMIEASKQANIYDFIMSLPGGFDTLVGERGVKLSGGQKQRIAIARVFLKNPPLLIFDEATSSLDNESESLIHQSMSTLTKDRTCLIIAHRLSTVKSADMIYVLKKGQIVEKGTHDELMKKTGYYCYLYNSALI